MSKRADLTTITADLQERAKRLQEQIGQAESRKITVDQKDGTLLGPGGLNLGDEQRIIVVDFCTVNRYYDRGYDSANPQPPACMAIGDIIEEMVPEEGVPAQQSPRCATCWANKWESDLQGGRGKACKNTRDLAVVLLDELEDPDSDPTLYVVSCSPTSLKSFDAAATSILRMMGGPPIMAQMTMRVKATKNYYNLQFGDIEENQYLERVYPLLETTADILGRMPDFSSYEEPKKLPIDDVRNQQRRR